MNKLLPSGSAIDFDGVTIQFSGIIENLPAGLTLDGMTDPDSGQFSFTVTSFAATQSEAQEQMDTFLVALAKKITPQ